MWALVGMTGTDLANTFRISLIEIVERLMIDGISFFNHLLISEYNSGNKFYNSNEIRIFSKYKMDKFINHLNMKFNRMN